MYPFLLQWWWKAVVVEEMLQLCMFNHVGRFVLLGVAARVPVREGVAAATGLLADLVCVTLPVLARVCVALPVAWLEDDRVGGGLEAVGDGVTGTHAPHVSPGNPGAPGVDAAATYPSAQEPE